MANTIDFTTLAVGALIGMGCKKQLRACGRIAAATAANLAGVAAATANQIAEQTKGQQDPEAAAAEQWTQRMDQQIQQQMSQNGN